jgi:hypothetical protein
MRPVDSINNSISGPNDKFSDPVRSFAVAIRDPETFVRYLRQEEAQRLGKQNRALPGARYVQMEVLSRTEKQERTPVLNMVVEQDDEMDMNSFVDLMEQVSALPAYQTKRSRPEDADISVYELQKPQRKTWTEQHTQQQHGNSLRKQRLGNRNTNPEGQREVTLNEPEEGLEQGRREQPQRKTGQGRYYRQRVKIAEPLLIFGEFGQRDPNYSRPVTLDFNRSKSHDILMVPSRYLLPPGVPESKHSNLPQDIPSFTETPVPKSSRKRNRQRTHNSRRPVDLSQPFSPVLHVYNGTNPPSSNISRVSTDIPRQSTDSDVSLVHIDIPRIYTTISHPHTDVSASPFTDISRVHIAISRQPSSSFRAPNSVGGLHGSSPPNESKVSHEPTTVASQPTETFQPIDSFRQYADTSPPSADIVPPLFAKFTKNATRNEQSYLSEESEGHEEHFIGNSPTYGSYQNVAPTDYGRESSNNTASSLLQPGEPVARNTEGVYLSRVAVQRERGDRKQHRPATGQIHRDDGYDELQLTAAETAYYKRRQLHKQAMILETSGECVCRQVSERRRLWGHSECMWTSEIRTGLRSEILNGKYRLRDIRIDGRVILKWMLELL